TRSPRDAGSLLPGVRTAAQKPASNPTVWLVFGGDIGVVDVVDEKVGMRLPVAALTLLHALATGQEMPIELAHQVRHGRARAGSAREIGAGLKDEHAQAAFS